MKIFKSIKWRLQIWYGLILVLVLAGSALRHISLSAGGCSVASMRNCIGALEFWPVLIHRPPPRRLEGNGQPFDRPPPGQFSADGSPEHDQHPALEFHLPPEVTHFFDAGDPNGFYFSIRAHDGKEIAGSTNQPDGTVATSTYTGGDVNWIQKFARQSSNTTESDFF